MDLVCNLRPNIDLQQQQQQRSLLHQNATLTLEVVSEPPAIFVTRLAEEKELLAGVEQKVVFSLYTGSYSLEKVRNCCFLPF